MVRHFLKDGTEVESVAGRVIKESEFKELYSIIRALNCKTEKNIDEGIRKNEIR